MSEPMSTEPSKPPAPVRPHCTACERVEAVLRKMCSPDDCVCNESRTVGTIRAALRDTQEATDA